MSLVKQLTGGDPISARRMWVLATNTSARAFYTALGFECDGAEKIDHRPGFDLHEVRYRFRIGGGGQP